MVSPKTGLASLTLLQQPADLHSRCDLAVSRLCIYFQKGNTPAIRTAIECVNKASKCFDRYGS